MPPRVYVETSVISYLTARLSRDPSIAAHQQVTRDWWTTRMPVYQVFVSEFVEDEAGVGDPVEVRKRLGALDGLERLVATPPVLALAEDLLRTRVVPANARHDAFHVAIAAVHGIDYLLTWNCKHIANPRVRPRLERACRNRACIPPICCTPQALMEGR